MEQIMKRRYPNSLPALMMTAATLPDPARSSGDNRSHTMEALEKLVKKLEGELEKKDEHSATLLRGMEQKYNSIKVRFSYCFFSLTIFLRFSLNTLHLDNSALPQILTLSVSLL